MIDTREINEWLIRADQPFRGIAQSFVLPDGTVAWADGLTPQQYAAKHGFPVRVVTSAQMDEMTERYAASLVTDPTDETESDWWYSLEVLPPCRWHTCKGVELFHISERVTLDLVSWHAKVLDRSGGDGFRFFKLTHKASADSEVLANAVIEASKAPAPADLTSYFEEV